MVMNLAAAKHSFSQCSTAQPSQIQNQSDFRATQGTGSAVKPLPSRPRKISFISPSISFPARAAVVSLLDWPPACVAHDFCNPEDPDALGDDSSLFAVTQQQWRACVRRMLRCKLACSLPPSSLDPRLAFWGIRCCEGRKSWQVYWRQAPTEWP